MCIVEDGARLLPGAPSTPCIARSVPSCRGQAVFRSRSFFPSWPRGTKIGGMIPLGVSRHSGSGADLFCCVAVLAALVVHPAAAQRTGLPAQGELAAMTVPRFEILDSEIQLTGPVRAGEYLGVTGPRAAWLGLETGQAELWIHPLKVGTGFRLSFTTPGYGSPIPGEQVARTVTVRPELATITYSHAAFQVRQHILAPRDTSAHGILVLLEVDAPEPIEIVAEFHPLLNYMWPASLGGQYAYWDAGRRAFVLSESLAERNVLVGSPWATLTDPNTPNLSLIHISEPTRPY